MLTRVGGATDAGILILLHSLRGWRNDSGMLPSDWLPPNHAARIELLPLRYSRSEMTMLDHAAFARLRLAAFFPELPVVGPDRKDPGAGRRFKGDAIVVVDDNWEYDDRINVGEVLGFTEVLRAKKDPARTRSVAVALAELPAKKWRAIVGALGLPVEKGMTARALVARLGKPAGRESFVPGQVQLRFRARAPAYRIDCTVRDKGGLSYVVVTRSR